MRKEKGRASPGARAETRAETRARRGIALLLFAVALAMRLLFWRATPDAAWPHSAYFKGDAPIWLEYARALGNHESYELGLPIHPPGTAHWIAFLWNGQDSGIAFLKFAWALLGALTVVLVYAAALRSFGLRVAFLAGAAAAASTGLMMLSTSLNVETPYLFLVAASLCLFEELRARAGFARLAVWSAINGVACLFRVEHLLFYGASLVFLALSWARGPAAGGASAWPRSLARVAASLALFLLPLVPWHVKTWRNIEVFNTRPRHLTPVEESAVRGVEEATSAMSWDGEARRKSEELPGFVRRTGTAFVVATVAFRGGREVRGQDFRILEEAFGYVPRALSSHPFVSSYGPLNFYLANHPGAAGGFDRSPLEEQPPLSGGAARYPAFLVQGLPPEQLTFVYPPHLHLFNDGYALGWKWIADHPREFADLAVRKLSIFWSGAALGFTGYNLPVGLSGVRRSVDLVAPEGGGFTTAWRVVVLAVCILGLAAARRRAALWPWLLFLATKAAVTVLFFGYARQGATVIPVVALLAALAADRWLFPRIPPLPLRRAMLLAGALLLLPIAIEAARFLSKPDLVLDGQPVGSADSFPPHLHRDQRLRVH